MNFTGYQPTSLAQLNSMTGGNINTSGLNFGDSLTKVDGFFNDFTLGSTKSPYATDGLTSKATLSQLGNVAFGEGMEQEQAEFTSGIRNMSPAMADLAAMAAKGIARGVDIGLGRTPIGTLTDFYNMIAKTTGLPELDIYGTVARDADYQADLAHLASNMGYAISADDVAAMDVYGAALDAANADRIGVAMEGGEGGGPDHGGMSDVGGFGDPNGHEGFGGYA